MFFFINFNGTILLAKSEESDQIRCLIWVCTTCILYAQKKDAMRIWVKHVKGNMLKGSADFDTFPPNWS